MDHNKNLGTSAGALDDFDTYDTQYYRRDFNARTDRPATHSYERARSGYRLGHSAAVQPTYQGRSFKEVEVELQRDYKPEENSTWDDVRDYAQQGFEWKTLLGGLAVAAGTWWAGKQVLDAFSEHSDEDEVHYRTHYDAHPARKLIAYPTARSYYALGYTASRNPEYTGRSYDQVEPEIRRGLTGSHAATYDTARDFYRTGYERGTARRTSI